MTSLTYLLLKRRGQTLTIIIILTIPPSTSACATHPLPANCLRFCVYTYWIRLTEEQRGLNPPATSSIVGRQRSGRSRVRAGGRSYFSCSKYMGARKKKKKTVSAAGTKKWNCVCARGMRAESVPVRAREKTSWTASRRLPARKEKLLGQETDAHGRLGKTQCFGFVCLEEALTRWDCFFFFGGGVGKLWEL